MSGAPSGTPPAGPGRLSRWSVRTQLVVWNSLALAVLLSVLGLSAHYMVRSLMMASVDRDLMRRTQALVAGPRLGGPPLRPGGLPPPGGWRPGDAPPGRFPGGPLDGPPDLQPGPRPPQMGEAGRRALAPDRPRLFDLQGRSLSPPNGGGPTDAAALSRAIRGVEGFATATVDGEPVRTLTRRVRRQGRVVAVAQASYPLGELNRALQGLDGVLLLLVPVAILFAALGGIVLTDRVLRPVRRIRQAAAQIGAERLSSRLPVSGRDEFAELSATFNQMLERLEGAFDEQTQLVKRLERMVEQQRRFTADASHELRTPLTVIKANTSLCLSGSSSDDELMLSMRDIDGAATAMSRLVQDLLLLARSDAGRLGLDRAPVPIDRILERAAGSVKRDGGPVPRVETAGEGALVLVNEDEIARVFANLLDNAVRHTPREGSVVVTPAPDGHSVRVQVRDTGAGIAPEHLAHLGERFYRVDTARSRADGGSGLGLSICRSILEAHGGSMRIESAEGAGTTVTVTLPAVRPDAC